MDRTFFTGTMSRVAVTWQGPFFLNNTASVVAFVWHAIHAAMMRSASEKHGRPLERTHVEVIGNWIFRWYEKSIGIMWVQLAKVMDAYFVLLCFRCPLPFTL